MQKKELLNPGDRLAACAKERVPHIALAALDARTVEEGRYITGKRALPKESLLGKKAPLA